MLILSVRYWSFCFEEAFYHVAHFGIDLCSFPAHQKQHGSNQAWVWKIASTDCWSWKVTTDNYTALRLTRRFSCKTVMCIEVTTYRHKDLRCGASFFLCATHKLFVSSKNNLFRQLLLPAAAAVKQLRKNHLPGGKHRASEGRASSKTTPKNCLTCRLKS